MSLYLIPIFCFGLVITGVVLLGIQEASELAKRSAAQSHAALPGSNKPPASSEGGSAPAQPSASVIQP